jgi:hypothetical protein
VRIGVHKKTGIALLLLAIIHGTLAFLAN